MKRIGICSYGYKPEDFPKITFSSARHGNSMDGKALNLKAIQQVSSLLYEKSELEGSLLINLMLELKAYPSQVLLIRFEDCLASNNKCTINLTQLRSNRRKRCIVTSKLYKQITEFKAILIN